MQPILWFVLGLIVAISGQAVAQSIYDSYGNPNPNRGYAPAPGEPMIRDSRGYLYSVPQPSPNTQWDRHRSPC